ncbi:MAG TPA: hypothetical protein VEK08_04075 [Planctomycetota bacterium]|nr:hypothetical protein [Planctomycetota bacterium]
MADLFEHDCGDLLVLGLGSFGGRIAARGAEDSGELHTLSSVRWSAAHTQPAELIATGLEKKVLLSAIDGPFAAQRAKHSVEQRRPEIARLVEGKSCALIVASLAEPSVRALMPPLAQAIAESRDISVCAILAEPALPAGPTADGSAIETALKEINFAADVTIRVPRKVLVAGMEQAPVGVLQSSAEQKTLLLVRTLLGVMSHEATGTLSMQALRERARGSGAVLSGLGLADNAESAVDAAFASLDLDAQAFEKKGAAMAVLTERDISASEAQSIMERFRGEAAAPTALIAFASHNSTGSGAACVVLLRQSAARNVVSLCVQ